MPTTLRCAEDALRVALAEVEAIGDASGWRDSHATEAHRAITSAMRSLASTDLDECRRWLDEETCQERTRPHRHCGARADVVIDGEGRCARHVRYGREIGALLAGAESC